MPNDLNISLNQNSIRNAENVDFTGDVATFDTSAVTIIDGSQANELETLSGTVESGGTPVEGAKVLVVDLEEDEILTAETTDQNGEFTHRVGRETDYVLLPIDYEPGNSDFLSSTPELVANVVPVIPDTVVENAAHYYDARGLDLSDGDTVSEWEDLSGDQNLPASGSPTFRESAFDGLPAIELTGGTDYFAASGVDVGDGFTVITKFQIGTWTGNQETVWSISDDTEVYLQPDSSEYILSHGDDFPTFGSQTTGSQLISSAGGDGTEGFARINGSRELTWTTSGRSRDATQIGTTEISGNRTPEDLSVAFVAIFDGNLDENTVAGYENDLE